MLSLGRGHRQIHPKEQSFVSGAPDNIKKWQVSPLKHKMISSAGRFVQYHSLSLLPPQSLQQLRGLMN
jgi:hypothetical protein